MRTRRARSSTDLDVGKTSAAANVAAQCVVIAKVEQHVDHAGKGIDLSAKKNAPRVRQDRSSARRSVDAVNRCVLVTKFPFETNDAEIVSGDRIDIEAGA